MESASFPLRFKTLRDAVTTRAPLLSVRLATESPLPETPFTTKTVFPSSIRPISPLTAEQPVSSLAESRPVRSVVRH